MTKTILNKFNTEILKVVEKAGFHAIESQGKVLNVGKAMEHFPQDSPKVATRRNAKTIIDEEVQEIILKEALKILDPSEVRLDAEEKTISTKYFNPKGKTTLVIDPIDGTLEYVLGHDTYSICVGLIEKGKVISAIVYFPAKSKFYFLDSMFNPILSTNIHISDKYNMIYGKDSNINRIFMMSRVPKTIAMCLRKKEYSVVRDIDNDNITWPEAFIECIDGKISSCAYHTPQVRDVLLGAIISYLPNGYALNWKGEALVWPNGGRIPRAIFGIGKIPTDILQCLNS